MLDVPPYLSFRASCLQFLLLMKCQALGLTFNMIALRCLFLVAARLGAWRSTLARIVLRTLGSGPRGVRFGCASLRGIALLRLGEKKGVFFFKHMYTLLHCCFTPELYLTYLYYYIHMTTSTSEY